jgi:hypothetical protein
MAEADFDSWGSFGDIFVEEDTPARSKREREASDSVGESRAKRSKPEDPIAERHLGSQDATASLRALVRTGKAPVPPLLLFGVPGTDRTGILLDLLGTIASTSTAEDLWAGRSIAACVVSCLEADSIKAVWQSLVTGLAYNEYGRLKKHPLAPSTDSDETSRVRPAYAGLGVGLGALLHGVTTDGPNRSEQLLRYHLVEDVSRGRRAVNSVSDVARVLRGIAPASAVTFLVFQHADRLCRLDGSCVSALLRISELTQRMICPVFVTDTPSAILSGVDRSEARPVMVRFRPPSDSDMLHTLEASPPSTGSPEVYRLFLRHVVSLFHSTAGNSPLELAHCATVLWSELEREAAERGLTEHLTLASPSLDSLASLFRGIRPSVLRLRSRLFHHDTSQRSAASLAASGLELACATKFALLAAHIASMNPPDTDRRFFTLGAESQKGRRKSTKSAATLAKIATKRLLGPRTFTLDRWMFIFQSLLALCDGASIVPRPTSCNVLSEAATLVSLNLVERVSAPSELDSSKFRCIADQATLQEVACKAGVELERFIFNPSRHT